MEELSLGSMDRFVLRVYTRLLFFYEKTPNVEVLRCCPRFKRKIKIHPAFNRISLKEKSGVLHYFY